MLFDSQPLVDLEALSGGLQGGQSTPGIAGPINIPQGVFQDNTPKGLFGIKGTARDILGILGDSLLVGAGYNPIYAPGRQKEKIGAAFEDFASNPMGAVERIAKAGDPQLAGQMYDRIIDNARQAEATGLQKAKIGADLESLYLDRSRPMLRTAKDEQSFNTMRDMIIRQARSRGVDIEGSLPATFKDLDAFIQAGIPLKDVISMENTERNREHQRGIAEDRVSIARSAAASAAEARRDAADARREANKLRERSETRADQKLLWEMTKPPKTAGGRAAKLTKKGGNAPKTLTYNPTTGKLE